MFVVDGEPASQPASQPVIEPASQPASQWSRGGGVFILAWVLVCPGTWPWGGLPSKEERWLEWGTSETEVTIGIRTLTWKSSKTVYYKQYWQVSSRSTSSSNTIISSIIVDTMLTSDQTYSHIQRD